MLENRISEHFEESEEKVPRDFYVIASELDGFLVAKAAAMAVIEALESGAMWVRFVDLHGAETCIRAGRIEYVRECTAEQRASARAFWRARKAERKADQREWDDD